MRGGCLHCWSWCETWQKERGALMGFKMVIHVLPGQLWEVHPEELVFYEHSGKHHLEPDKVRTLGADNVEVHGVVHPSNLEHLQVGAGVALEETNEISGEVLVGKVEVELWDAVVQTVANSWKRKLEYFVCPKKKYKGVFCMWRKEEWPESLDMDFPCVLITSSLEMMLKQTIVRRNSRKISFWGASPGEEGVFLLIDLTVN